MDIINALKYLINNDDDIIITEIKVSKKSFSNLLEKLYPPRDVRKYIEECISDDMSCAFHGVKIVPDKTL